MLLYKYIGREQFFSNFKIRLTPPNALNDPRECVPEIKLRDPRGYINNVIQRNFESGYIRLLIENPHLTPEQALHAYLQASTKTENDFHENNEEWIRRIFDSFMKVTNRHIGVLSLSETNNNELMWAHYANSHNGYVIGFDSENPFFKPTKSDPKVCGELMNVQYTDVAPIVYVDPGKFDIPKELFFTKTLQWSYEREWRMIKMLTAADEVIDEKIHLFQVPIDSVKEVIFGMKVSEPKRKDIESLLLSTAPHITFRSAKFDHRGSFTVA